MSEIKYSSSQVGLTQEDLSGYQVPESFELRNNVSIKPKLNYSMLDAATSVINGLSPTSQIVYDILDDTEQRVKSTVGYEDLNKRFNREDYFMNSGASLDEANYYFSNVHSYADAEAWRTKRNFILEAKKVAGNSGFSGIVADLISSTIGDPVAVVSVVAPGAVMAGKAKMAEKALMKQMASSAVLSSYDEALGVASSRIATKTNAKNISILKTTGEAVGGGLAFSVADEVMRRQLDPTRTEEDSTNAIVTTTLFSGILGGAFGTYRYLKDGGHLKRISKDLPDKQAMDKMADDGLSAARAGFDQEVSGDLLQPQGAQFLSPLTKNVAGALGPRNRGLKTNDPDIIKDYADIYGRPSTLLRAEEEGVGLKPGVAEVQETFEKEGLLLAEESEFVIQNLMKKKNIDRNAAQLELYLQMQSLGEVTESGETFLRTHIADDDGLIDAAIKQIKAMRKVRQEQNDLGFGDQLGDIKGYAFPVMTNRDAAMSNSKKLHDMLKEDVYKKRDEIVSQLRGGVASIENLQKITQAEKEFQILQFAERRGVDLNDAPENATGFGGGMEKVIHDPRLPDGTVGKITVKSGKKELEVKFDSDFDYALYQVAKTQKEKQSPFFQFVRNNSEMSDQEILAASRKVRDRVEELRQNNSAGSVLGVKRVHKNEVTMGSPALDGMAPVRSAKVKLKPAENRGDIASKATQVFKDDAEFQKMMEDMQDEIYELKALIDDVESVADDTANQALTRWSNGMPYYVDTIGIGRVRDKPGYFLKRKIDPIRYAEFLETNPQILNAWYFKQHGLAVGMKTKFGSHKPSDAMKKIREKYDMRVARMRTAGDYEGADKLLQQISAMEKDFSVAIDQMQGTYAKDFYSKYGTAATVMASARTATALAKLGNQVMGSLPEIPAILLAHHIQDVMPTATKAIKFLSRPENFKMATRYLKSGGKAFELTMNNLQYSSLTANGGIGEALTRGENFLGLMRKWGQRINGAVYYDYALRTFATVTQQSMFIENLKRMASGKVTANQMEQLAFMGISKDEAGDFLKKISGAIHEEDGLHFIDFNRIPDKSIAIRAKVALDRDLRRTYLQKRIGDNLHIMDHPAMSVITQFKSWPLMATQNYMIPMLQRSDANTLAAFAMMAGFGSLVVMMKEAAQGRDMSQLDPVAVLYAGADTAIGGIFSEALNPLVGRYMTMAGMQPLGASRFYDRQTALEAIAGPSAGMLNDLFRGGYYGLQGIEAKLGADVNDTSNLAARSIMRVLPFNNLPVVGNATKEYLAPKEN